MKTVQPQAGYTLVEVVVAGLILAVGVVAISTSIRSSSSLQLKNDWRRKAAIILDNAMEASAFHPSGCHQWFSVPTNWSSTCNIPGSQSCSITATMSENPIRVEGMDIPTKQIVFIMQWEGDVLRDTLLILPLTYSLVTSTNPICP
jgi:Tfp pilus assembly protein PilE